jgi:uncharacterized protein (TIRG00374 family)
LKRLLLSLLITVGIFFVLFTQISLEDLYHLLKNINLLWVILGSMGYLLAILFRAIRFRWLIHSKNIPLSELFKITIFYNLSLMILPSKLGELAYPYFLNKISGLTITEGLASLITSRVYDFFIILLIFLITSIGFQSLFKTNLFLITLFVALLICVTLLVFFYMSNLLKFSSNVLRKISEKIGAKNSKPFQWSQRKIHEMAEDFYAIKARRTYLPVAMISLISWIMVFWMFYAFLMGFGISISFFNVIFGSTIAIFANALPISGLGNWGILEAGWATGFLLVGLSKGEAIATGFGVHILIFIIASIAGIICWLTFYLPAGKQKRQSPSLLDKK